MNDLTRKKMQDLLRLLCKHYGTDLPVLTFHDEAATEFLGTYRVAGRYLKTDALYNRNGRWVPVRTRPAEIDLWSDADTGTLVHEFCHHLDIVRRGKDCRVYHGVVFHRICFEVRDMLKDVHGWKLPVFNGYYRTRGYHQAWREQQVDYDEVGEREQRAEYRRSMAALRKVELQKLDPLE